MSPYADGVPNNYIGFFGRICQLMRPELAKSAINFDIGKYCYLRWHLFERDLEE